MIGIQDQTSPRKYAYPTAKGRRFHIAVWEDAYGTVPDGYLIHHLNEDKYDYRLGNLMPVTPTEHRRIHSGWKIIDGVWWRPCTLCERLLPYTTEFWYMRSNGLLISGCRACNAAIYRAKKEVAA